MSDDRDDSRVLSQGEMEALVERIAFRVRRELQLGSVPPSPVVRGTWQDQSGLKQLLGCGATRLGTDGAVSEGARELARFIDHTLLKPTATRQDIVELCQEAREHGFATVCVNTTWIPLAAKLLGKDFHVFAAMSDGEQQKGQPAEARRFAKKYGLNNITVIVVRHEA